MFKQIIGLMVLGSALISGAAQAADHCEAIRLENGTTIRQCDATAYPQESAACEYFAMSYGTDFEMAYEACMVIAVRTPGAVKSY